MGIRTKPRSDSFDLFPPEQRKKKLWDPITTLDIGDPSGGYFTCVGFAPSRGRQCRNPVNQTNRASASRLLEDLSYIDVSTTNIDEKLHQLARLTLCLRNHQSQADDMVEKWSRKIHQTRTTSRNSTDIKIDLDEFEELLSRVFNKTNGAGEYIFSSPASHSYRKQHNRQSAQEERTRKQQDEEARKSRERERQRQQQERAKREQEETARQKRAEEKRRKEEQEASDKEAREREERNERIRQRAEQARKERERKAREQAAKERDEWDKIWLNYVMRWGEIRKTDVKTTSEKLRELIPWPVKSGDWRDVSASAVQEFYQKAPPETNDTNKMLAVMKMECLKWHTDRIPRMFGVIEDKTLAALFTTVAQIAIKIRAETGCQRER